MAGMGKIKTVFKITFNLFTVALVVLVASVSISNILHKNNPEYVPGIGPYKMLTVLSDSMKPKFSAGDLIIVKTATSGLKQNDIITFWRSKKPPVLITHRVTEIEEVSGHLHYITKGDANNTKDGTSVPREEILGKYLLSIPFGGYIASFVRSKPGFILLILIPMIAAGVHELKRNRIPDRSGKEPVG